MSDTSGGQGSAARGKGRPPTINRFAALDGALLTFWDKGYEGASLTDLTAAMNLSRPSLYAAFGDKAALFDAVLVRYAETVGARPLAALLAEPDLETAVRAFLTVSLEGNTQTGCPSGCLVACCAMTAAESDEKVLQRCNMLLQATEQALADRFAAEPRLSGNVSPQDRAALMVDFMYAQALRARAGMTRQSLMQGLDSRVRAVLSSG